MLALEEGLDWARYEGLICPRDDCVGSEGTDELGGNADAGSDTPEKADEGSWPREP